MATQLGRGKLMRTIMVGLAEFERDLIRDRVKSAWQRLEPRAANSGTRWANVASIESHS
jgi:DNA invertase Pin-like site-specific DNA recombinase